MLKNRKNIVIFAVFVLAVTAGWFLFFRSPSEDQEIRQALLEAATTSTFEDSKKDSDNDGLKDWEEVIRRTDALNADTDGDGTNDGDEIAQNRDPLKPGPDDSLVPASDGPKTVEELKKKLSEGDSATELLIRKLINERGVATVLNVENKDAISSDILGFVDQLKEAAITGAESTGQNQKISVIETEDPKALAAYFNSIASLYEKNLSGIAEDDIALLGRAFSEKNVAPLETIAEYRTRVENLITGLQNLSVPRPVLELHKKELFYLSQTAQHFDLMSRANLNDPLYLLVLIALRRDLQNDFGVFHANEVASWIKTNNLVSALSNAARAIYRL